MWKKQELNFKNLMMDYRLKTDIKSYFTKGKVYGKKGDRVKEVSKLEPQAIFKIFKHYSLNEVWDFEQVVQIAENLELKGKLPSGFMLLQPQSWSEDVWTDITRMRTLNGSQWSLGKEMHICPLQFDIVDRIIEQMSNPGDVVLDYFAGLFTVPLRAMMKGRKGYGIELKHEYFLDGVNYCKAEELKQGVPTLFELIEAEKEREEVA
jgi:DNA modification methylase